MASNSREKREYMQGGGGGKEINTRKREPVKEQLPQFLPYDDAYEQDENEDDDGGHDALLVHPARKRENRGV